MGVFDVFNAPLAWLSAVVSPIAGADLAIIGVTGATGGFLSMALYRWLSPQQRLAAWTTEIRAVRAVLVNYDGEMAGMLALIRRVLGLSLRQLAASGWSALLASLPVLFFVSPLSSLLDYERPSAGQWVKLTMVPASEAGRVTVAPPSSLVREADDSLHVRWPDVNSAVRLQLDGQDMLGLPAAALSPVIEGHAALNYLFGNPNGYLPAGSTILRVELHYKPREMFDFGPVWLRAWWVPFFVVLVATSLLLKWRWKIH
jgi:hypothetical protein